jgi:ParB family chromosome partitioning protein
MATALVENIQREDLNPLEEAQALRRLIDEFELSHQDVAEAIGRSRSAVSNLLRLLDAAPGVQTMLGERQLEMGHARTLLALPTERQDACAREVARRGLSVRETERLVKRLLSEGQRHVATRRMDPDVRRLQDELSECLGARVVLNHAGSGRGRVVIHYTSVDELDGIVSKIK